MGKPAVHGPYEREGQTKETLPPQSHFTAYAAILDLFSSMALAIAR